VVFLLLVCFVDVVVELVVRVVFVPAVVECLFCSFRLVFVVVVVFMDALWAVIEMVVLTAVVVLVL